MRQKRGQEQAGYSLVEIMVVLVVLVSVAAIGFWNLGRRPMATHGKSMAQVLAAALSNARERAISQGFPVALVFPSAGGTRAYAQSFYLLEGATKPRVTRITNLAGDHPKTVIFNGVWSDSSLSAPLLGTRADLFDLDAWQMPYPEDYAFVFLPSGALLTNGLPITDGKYHLVTSFGIAASPASRPPGQARVSDQPSYFVADKLAHPYTVSITPLGQVDIETGAPDSEVSSTQGDFLGISAPPSPPPLSQASTVNPTFQQVSLSPDPSKQELPPGVDVLVASDGRLSLVAELRSPEGAEVFCTWTASVEYLSEDPSGESRKDVAGRFSSQGKTRCSYDPNTGLWKSHWEWIPPPGGLVGDKFELNCVAEDAWGNRAPAVANTQLEIQLGVISPKVFFLSDRRNKDEVYLTGEDGAGTRRISNHDKDVRGVTPSPDGSHLAYEYEGKLYISNSDGTAARSIEDLSGRDPSWLADGTKLAFAHDTSLYVVNADGSGLTELTPGHSQEVRYPSWSEDGTKLAFTSVDPAGEETSLGRAGFSVTQGGNTFNPAQRGSTESPKGNIWSINNDGTDMDQLTQDDKKDDIFPNFSPDGRFIIFSRQDEKKVETRPSFGGGLGLVLTAGEYNLFRVRSDGTGLRKLRGPSPVPYEAFWSPDGKKIAFTERALTTSKIFTMAADGSQLTEVSNGLAGVSTKPIWMVGEGNRLVFQNGTGREQDIYIVQSDGNGLVRLTDEPGMDVPVGTSW